MKVRNPFVKLIMLVWLVSFIPGCTKDTAPTEPDSNIPRIPTLLSPPNNEVNIPTSCVLTWNISDRATSYTLQLSTNSSFPSLAYNQNGIKNPGYQVTGLSRGVTYYWRVRGANSFGTSDWSAPVWSFKTAEENSTGAPCPGMPTVNYGGITYNTVQIGSQCWLKENLNIGMMILVDKNGTNNGIIEKYCINNDTNNCAIYGGLYQWDEAMAYNTMPGTKGICPEGWHIPTRGDYDTLSASVNNISNVLKAVGQGAGNGAGTNTSGFSALLSGYRNGGGYFGSVNEAAYFWTSTISSTSQAYFRHMTKNDFYFFYDGTGMNNGLNIRCIKN